MKAYLTVLLFLVALPNICWSQTKDSTSNLKSVVVPSGLLIYGIVGTYTDLGLIPNERSQSLIGSSGNRTSIDDFLAPSPAGAVYGLNLLGVKGKNNFWDRTVILGTSYLVVTPIVLATKKWTSVLRPDGSEFTSFPSGHTAIAFASAEFLRQEYKDQSPWYGVAGYSLACATGALRIYNNRHWLADVSAGAGLGIFSTLLAYKVHPWVHEKLGKNPFQREVLILPSAGGNLTGFQCVVRF